MDESLYSIASKFRNAIQQAIICGDIIETNMRYFPFGCCGYTCDLFQRYLAEIGIDTLYCSGRYGYGWDAENHAWLETRAETVIDITGDQFADKTPRFTCAVYVGPRENGFHNEFVQDRPLCYNENRKKLANDSRFEARYNAVLKHMN